MPVTAAQFAVWQQVARLQDYSQGTDGRPRSEMPDSPLGRTIWFSPAAQKAASRSDDLAHGYAQLVGMRVEILEAGGDETTFVRTAVAHEQYGPLYRWILETYLHYTPADHGV